MEGGKKCYACDDDATHTCGNCKTWHVCSAECSDAHAHIHAAVCHNLSSADPAYVSEQLAQTIADMMEDVDRRYTPDETGDPVEDAVEVLSALQDPSLPQHLKSAALEEAHEIIGDHLYDYAGQEAYNEFVSSGLVDDFTAKKIIYHHPDYATFHATNIALDRIEAEGDSDYNAARRELQEAKKRARDMLKDPKKRFNQAKKERRRLNRAARKAKRMEKKSRSFRKKGDRRHKQGDVLYKRADRFKKADEEISFEY